MSEPHLSARTYLFTWIALVVLSALTLLLSVAPLGPFHVPVALLIAGTKGVLIVLFFMHLVEQRSVNRVAVIFWLLLLLILISLTAADVATRSLDLRPPVSG
ncbi:MAG TPA: cytochrome C oxidase subunit IV family protein [Longimicrobiales bacterium]